MKAAAAALSIALVSLCLQPVAQAAPEDDRKAFVAYFQSRFPDVDFAEFANGIYAIDADARSQWQEIEEFPPYEFSIERGQELWHQTLPNDSLLGDCFEKATGEVRAGYPRFDSDRGEVVTLEVAINDCRSANGAQPYAYDSAEMIDLTAFLAYEARGKTVNVDLPDDHPGALAAYEAGKRFYYSKRGQLNFACADCHVTSVGQRVRADRLSPSLGHPTHFPVYRSKLGGMITLQQRFAGCVRDVRAKPFELQSPEYRTLEFFLAYMSNGLTINGPGARK
jgi:sulfur-oxidizing protein SoxA